VKPLGPVHEYVAFATVEAVRLIVLPIQTGELLLTVGAAGDGLITTVVTPDVLLHPLTVTVTE
jgi:ABC-type uncharacterized transport system ATPase subunit